MAKIHKVNPFPPITSDGNLNIEGHQIVLKNSGNFDIVIEGLFKVSPGESIHLDNIYPDVYKIDTKVKFIDTGHSPANPRLDILVTNIEGLNYNHNNNC